MKKKIAVFANGWGDEYLREIVSGAFEIAEPANCDLFCFVNFSVMVDQEKNKGEGTIFRLPDLKDFNGAILMPNSYNCESERTYLHEAVLASGIPAISLEYDLDGMISIHTDNYYGMKELSEHIIVEHGAKEIVFIGGPEEHPECQIRLQALKDVATEHGISIPEENIMFSDWAKNYAKTLIGQWVESHQGLPDAVVCANDIMAMGVCDWMKEHDYRVPEDVIITGYDFTQRAQEYVPSISSVSHEWVSMGVKAMELLLDLIEGKACEEIEPMRTRFFCAESCCSDMNLMNTRITVNRKRSSRHQKMEGTECDSHFRHIFGAANQCENMDQLYYEYGELFRTDHWMEGNDFILCLEEEPFQDEVQGINNRETFSDVMDMVCYMRNGEIMPRAKIRSKEAIFLISDQKTEPAVYIFVPLAAVDNLFGFAMLVRDIDIVLENYLYSWTRHMNQDLEHFRRNLIISQLTNKLRRISVTDNLTGVYNRAGCEEIAYPMLRNYKKAGETGVLMIADIDRMKAINDLYGHANGDLALKTIASVLKSQVPEDWIVSRFGGDEFFVAGKLNATMDLDAMVQSMMDRLKEEIREREITFSLSMSVGYAKIEPNDNLDIEKSLREADKLMYLVKKVHHEQQDRK
ncbi:MAG: GGDEF domain-containing protein [Eubacteriales bacterium]|nr:GGDEF domain-containing protein [Eubacteriales bacterium]